MLLSLMVLLVALSVGFGIGFTRHKSSSSWHPSTDNPAIVNGSSSTVTATPKGIWAPKSGTSWQIDIQTDLQNASFDVDVYDIDLFTNTAATISNLHSQGRKVICYFSAGSYEDYRPDKSKFKASDRGKPLDGWPGEWWLNTRSSNVRNIMLSRLDQAVAKGCDGVDPDNIDAYDNENGLGLTMQDAINYVNFLADAAHARKLSIGLKNGGAIISQVIDKMQWEVNEQCVEYHECSTFQPFIAQHKPVFHIEYPPDAPTISSQTKKAICGDQTAKGFSTVLKNLNLDDWAVPCPLW